MCVDTVKEPSSAAPAHPPCNKEATCSKKKERKNSSIATLFYSLFKDYIFSPHFGMAKRGRTVGFLGEEVGWGCRGEEGVGRETLCAQAVTEGAGTAVSGSLKRFSQAEIFNLLRENKAEKKQRTKRS